MTQIEEVKMTTRTYNDAEEVILYMVWLEGRGGDSGFNAYFETEEAAIFASALDGQNLTPKPVDVLKLSDGSYVQVPMHIRVQSAPSEEKISKLGIPEQQLTPAQRLLLARKTRSS